MSSDSSNALKIEKYEDLLKEISGLIDPACGPIANYANISAAITQKFKHWWCGFYLVNENHILELGPFQGPVACTLISYNKGVCGKAWAEAKTIVVPNVHEFEGHIACSSESNSEIVVPLFREGKVIGVLDLDSIHFNCFDDTDAQYLEKIVQLAQEMFIS